MPKENEQDELLAGFYAQAIEEQVEEIKRHWFQNLQLYRDPRLTDEQNYEHAYRITLAELQDNPLAKAFRRLPRS